jgi:hypothetical protein
MCGVKSSLGRRQLATSPSRRRRSSRISRRASRVRRVRLSPHRPPRLTSSPRWCVADPRRWISNGSTGLALVSLPVPVTHQALLTHARNCVCSKRAAAVAAACLRNAAGIAVHQQYSRPFSMISERWTGLLSESKTRRASGVSCRPPSERKLQRAEPPSAVRGDITRASVRGHVPSNGGCGKPLWLRDNPPWTTLRTEPCAQVSRYLKESSSVFCAGADRYQRRRTM